MAQSKSFLPFLELIYISLALCIARFPSPSSSLAHTQLVVSGPAFPVKSRYNTSQKHTLALSHTHTPPHVAGWRPEQAAAMDFIIVVLQRLLRGPLRSSSRSSWPSNARRMTSEATCRELHTGGQRALCLLETGFQFHWGREEKKLWACF